MTTPLDPQRWQRLDAIFAAVADLPPEQQAAEVTRLADGDAALAEEVLRLLTHDRSGDRRIVSVLAGVAQWPPTEPAAPPDLSGRRIGPYRLVRELGRGGMGVVYEALRDDEFQQRVALKMAARAAYAPDLLARFRDERQILARLSHPRIARLLDGGTTNDGVPWFAMEFVDGMPIHRHVAETRPVVEARLALFLQVCEAVEYAHQNLVVHRDLKPANILVTSDGVRLLDFGIARLLETTGDATITSGVATPITPDYGSPEQVRGEPPTTRTDVYSLGLVLYELLTGTRAQTADTSSPLALARSICDTTVPAPSAAPAVAGGPLARRLRGDLDTIVQCATQKDPARRYQSVAALAEDVRRHLDGHPIVARQDSRAYRTRRFVRRHWLPLGAVAALLVTLTGGIVATRYQARRAERRFQEVRGIATALMNDVHDAIRELPSSTAAQETVLRTAVHYLDGLAREAGSDRTLQVEVARGYLKASEMAYSLERPSLGRADEGRRYLDQAVTALAPLEATAAGDPAVAAAVVERYRLTADLALDQSRRDDALAALRSGFEIGDRALRGAPDDIALITTVHDTLVELISTFNTDAWVVGLVPRILEVSDHRMALQPNDPDARGQLAVTYSQIGNVASARGDADQARQYYQRAVDLHTAIVQAAPNHTTARRNLMIALANLADVWLGPLGSASYTGSGGPPQPLPAVDRATALAAYTRACEQADWLLAQDRANDTAAFDFAVCRGRMAVAYPPGDPVAITTLNSVLIELQELAARHPSRVAAFEIELRGSLAERYRQTGAFDRADEEWARVDGVVRRGVASEPQDFYLQRLAIPVFENQAETLAARGRAAEARRVAVRVEALAAAVAARADTYARAPGWPPRVRAWLAALHEQLGNAEAARVARHESLAMWRAVAARADVPADLTMEARQAIEPGSR